MYISESPSVYIETIYRRGRSRFIFRSCMPAFICFCAVRVYVCMEVGRYVGRNYVGDVEKQLQICRVSGFPVSSLEFHQIMSDIRTDALHTSKSCTHVCRIYGVSSRSNARSARAAAPSCSRCNSKSRTSRCASLSLFLGLL